MKFNSLAWLSGFLIGFVLGTGVLWLAHYYWVPYKLITDNISDALTTLVPLAAAGFALWGIMQQIQHSDERAEKTRLAKLDAERSFLPVVLSNIIELCRERYHGIAKGNLRKPAGAIWEISDLERSTLKSCVEYADKSEKYWLIQIPLIYQVLIARWKNNRVIDLRNDGDINISAVRLDSQIYEITNWITMQVICESLLKYARAKSSIPDKNVMRKLIILKLEGVGIATVRDKNFFTINNPRYSKFVEELQERGRIPFIDVDWDQ